MEPGWGEVTNSSGETNERRARPWPGWAGGPTCELNEGECVVVSMGRPRGL